MLIHYPSLNSTNEYLKVKYPFLDDFTAIYTDYQTNGHGRYNRMWESENGKNLLLSLLIKDKKIIRHAESLSLLTGVVLYKLLTKFKLKNVSIKWPNDIYVNDKKICGILLESASIGEDIQAIIIGIGLNLNQERFNSVESATSYFLETKKHINIEKVAHSFLFMIEREIMHLIHNHSDYLNVVNSHNFLLNKSAFASIENNYVPVIVKDINTDNTINVIFNDKPYKIRSGELKLSL